MKRKLITLATLAMLVVAAVGMPGTVAAQAYSTTFTTSITYQNVGTGLATISMLFYPENNGTPIPIARPTLAKDAGTSVFVGSLTAIAPGFRGSVVLQSDQPIVATLVQLPQGSATVKNRALSNGFSTGAANSLIATVLKNKFGSTSRFAVQNIDSVGADLSLSFYDADTPANPPIVKTVTNLPAGAAQYFDLGILTGFGSVFNGSVAISAKKTGTATLGNIVSTVMEMSIAGTAVSAFEGVAGGSKTVYMPSALCNAFGGQNTAYAVQNTSLSSSATVTVTYSNGLKEGPLTVNAGTKRSFLGCTPVGMPAGFSGSAIVTASGADIVAIGKVSGLGLSTAFVGASSGAAKLALPYVRWSETQYASGARQKTSIAIQNVGGALAAGAVTVSYVDKNGVVVGTHPLGAIASGAKANSNPSNIGAAGAEFGYYGDGTFGGSAVISGPVGSQLVAVARVSSSVPPSSLVAEDYNGIPIP